MIFSFNWLRFLLLCLIIFIVFLMYYDKLFLIILCFLWDLGGLVFVILVIFGIVKSRVFFMYDDECDDSSFVFVLFLFFIVYVFFIFMFIFVYYKYKYFKSMLFMNLLWEVIVIVIIYDGKRLIIDKVVLLFGKKC